MYVPLGLQQAAFVYALFLALPYTIRAYGEVRSKTVILVLLAGGMSVLSECQC